MSTAVAIRALAKNYGITRALKGIDVEVAAGEVFGFLGPNGAGKTTTIRIILGLQEPAAGESCVLGFDSQRQAVEVGRRVGYLPGDLVLFPRKTGRFHIEWFARARGLVDLAYTRGLIDRFSVVTDRPIRELSKGNRQKLGIVLAFMHSPEVLILDEPTSGLDPLMQSEFEKLVRETVADGRTVFLSSHELGEVQRLADRVAIIRSGELMATDSVAGLRHNAPTRVEVEFAQPARREWFDSLDGVAVVTCDGPRVSLDATGKIGALLQAIAKHDPLSMTSRPASLDELFMKFYQEPATPQGAHVS